MTVTYVGADVHQATTTIEMQNEEGLILSKMTLRTDATMLVSLLEAQRGRVVLAVEESCHSRWLYNVLGPVVDDLIICDPAFVRPSHVESKSDVIDAHWLVEGARTGTLKRIHHDDTTHSDLVDLAKGHALVRKQVVATKSRIQSLYRTHGIWSEQLYAASRRETLLGELAAGAATRMTWLYEELDHYVELKSEAQKELVRCAKRQDPEGWRSVHSTPAFGDIRTAETLAWVGTPWRFRTERQLRKYVGLAVSYHSSSDYDEHLKRRTSVRVKGLNKHFNRPLKAVFKGAAESAALLHRAKYPEIAAYYARREAEHGYQVALVDVARKLVAIVWTVWKRKEEYDPQKAVWTA